MSRWCAISAIRHRNFSPCGIGRRISTCSFYGTRKQHRAWPCFVPQRKGGRYRRRCLGDNEPGRFCHHRSYAAEKSGADHHRQRGEWVDRLSAIFHGRKLATRSDCAGCRNYSVTVVTAQKDVAPTVAAALGADQGPSVIVIRTEVGMPDNIAVIPLGAIEIRDRFVRSLGGSSRQSDVIILEEQGIWSTKPAFARFTVV